MNLDKLASATLVLSMTVSRLSKGQQKTLRKKIKQKRTKMRKKSKGTKRVRSGIPPGGGPEGEGPSDEENLEKWKEIHEGGFWDQIF